MDKEINENAISAKLKKPGQGGATQASNVIAVKKRKTVRVSGLERAGIFRLGLSC